MSDIARTPLTGRTIFALKARAAVPSDDGGQEVREFSVPCSGGWVFLSPGHPVVMEMSFTQRCALQTPLGWCEHGVSEDTVVRADGTRVTVFTGIGEGRCGIRVSVEETDTDGRDIQDGNL